MVLSETRGPSAFSGYPRGHRVNTETGCRGTVCLQDFRILTLDPERRKSRLGHRQQQLTGRWKRALDRRRSGHLWFQFLSVEAFSFLPQRERNGRELARQRQPRQAGLHALGE